jgi:hypothetical protein
MTDKIKVCVTVDTEGDSANNPNSTFIGIRSAIPKLVDVLDKYKIKATFFVQEDKICQVGTKFAHIWKSLEESGHEIGYHAHGILLSPPEDRETIITQGITRLRNLGLNPISYRGGRFHLNGDLLKVLEKNNIKYDSSVVPGLREVFKDGTVRCNHVGAPRKPYFPSYIDHTKPGDSTILELPVNRYPMISPEIWGGVLTVSQNDESLFDYFTKSQKDNVVIIILHSWSALSYKIRDSVRFPEYGRLKKITYEFMGKIFNKDFLTNGAHYQRLERVLKYVLEKENVCFTTIRQAGESWAKENL